MPVQPPTFAEPPSTAAPEPRTPRPTAAARLWVTIAVATILLILLIVFIAENSRTVTVAFLGLRGTLSLAFAILIAAVAGVLITLLVGTARILQLRRELKRHR